MFLTKASKKREKERGEKREKERGRKKKVARKKDRIGLLVLLTICLNLTKIKRFQDRRKETRLIMPIKIVIRKEKERNKT